MTTRPKLPKGLGSVQRAVYLALLGAPDGLTFSELLDLEATLNDGSLDRALQSMQKRELLLRNPERAPNGRRRSRYRVHPRLWCPATSDAKSASEDGHV